MIISASPLSLLLLVPWTVLWLAGGILLTWAAFRLRPNEQIIVGLGLGWLIQVWLANILSLVLPVPYGFWLSALLLFVAGLAAVLRAGGQRGRLHLSVPQLLVLAGICLAFFSAARGLAIFDDFAHLPTVSLMAAGDFPPHFPLDAQVRYGYHHFLLLFSAQLIRLGGLSPWWALDAGRALSFGLAVMLSALFAQRLTRSRAAGFLGGLAVAFGSGARWLLLLAPPVVVEWLSGSITLIGSGAGSGSNLREALVSFWAVEGAGPIAFPFGFANGVFPAGVVLAHTANGLTGFVVVFLLLMTFNRWRSAWGAVLSAIMIAVWGLLGEAELPLIAAGWGLVALGWTVAHRSLRLPRSLWVWLSVAGAGCIIGMLEGGAWTDILVRAAAGLFGQSVASYQTVGFQLGAPALVSSHLGVMPVANPATLLVALAELGPVVLVFPLLVIWGLKAFRLGRWYESAAAATAGFGLMMLFVQFSGSTGVRNTPRLYVFVPLLLAFAVPLVWLWAERRSSRVKMLAAGLGLVLVFGGLVMAGFHLFAIQRPVYSYFLTPLDVRMTHAHWNRLDPGTLVFDPVPFRAPTVFGRHTNASYTWYQAKPEWEALYQAPEPARLRAAGFRYIYIDNQYWDAIDPRFQPLYGGGCALLVDEYSDKQGSFRRLFDLKNCQ